MKRFMTGVAGGLVGAAVVLAIAGLLGLAPLGSSSTEPAAEQGKVTYTSSTGLTPQQIYQQHADSVVKVISTFPGSTDFWGQSTGEQQGVGSGFVVSTDGYILTNAHVVSESGQIAGKVEVMLNREGKQTTTVGATIIGIDDSTDVALLKVDTGESGALDAIPLGNSADVQVGEQVVAIGNPLNLEFSLSAGIVSATDREMQAPDGGTIANGIQTDASINPGNSGGPLIDASGKVIGINEQIASQSGGNEGIGFAVPIDTAIKVMEQMKGGSFQPASPDQGQAEIDPGQIF
jgi:S1-C subfamily serine protease